MDEIITENNDILAVVQSISEKADALLDARTIKEDKATVIMNPDFVALLTHEILGHPSEADRVLGKERHGHEVHGGLEKLELE